MAVLEYIPTDKEPDERIYWILVSIPVLFFIIGVFFLCWNRCSLLKSNCSTKTVKEDLNPDYETDLDEFTSVAEVAVVLT